MVWQRSAAFALVVSAVVAMAATPARAQVFDYAVQDSGAAGALGSAVERLGDYDGDGADELAVGEPNWGSGQYGYVRVFSGKPGYQLLSISNFHPYSSFGAALEGTSDLDGDGYDDLVIGSPTDSYYAIYQGGSVTAISPYQSSYLYTLYSPQANANFGTSVRSLHGDLDGDGVDDLVIGAPGIDTIYVVSGATGAGILSKTGQNGSRFGFAVGRAGDLDGDHVVDFIVASPDYVDGAGRTTGRVSAFSGKDGSKLWSIDGAADSGFGHALGLPGDVDGDGVKDIVVGAPHHLDPNGVETGSIAVLSGVDGSVIYKAYGDQKNDTFGHDVRGAAGDIDHDGVNDILVGAPQNSGSDVGYARVLSGATGKTLFTYYEATSDPHTKSDYGWSVAGGEFDGDGRVDVAIGGRNFDSGDGIAEVWSTAVASWQNYGNGWPGTLGVPTLTPRSDPVVGQNLKIDLTNSLGATTSGLLFLGESRASIHTGKGGKLLVTPLMSIPISIPGGGLTLSGSIPDDPALYGFILDLQAIEVDAGASKGLSFTDGLELFFGFP